MEDLVEILKYLGVAATGGFFSVIICIGLYLKYQDSVERTLGYVFSWAKFLGKNVRKQAIASELRGNVLKASKIITNDIPGIIPFDLKVEWVGDVDKETFINNEKVVIRMNNNKNNRTKNIVHIVKEFVDTGMLHNTKSYIDKKLVSSSQLMMTRKILMECSDESLNYFDQTYISPVIENDSECKEMISKISNIDTSGLFVKILLTEFMRQGNKLYPKIINDECLLNESREFLNFVHTIVMKEPGKIVELCFLRNYFKVAIILFAKEEKIHTRGFKPYKERIVKCLNDGVETVYVLADTEEKSLIASSLSQEIESMGLNIKSIQQYDYKRIKNRQKNKGVCICIESVET